MANKRYLIDFICSSGGTVMITGKNKKDALKKLDDQDYVWNQVADQLDETRPSEFDIKFDKRSIVEDEDEGTDPYTDYKGPKSDEEE